MSVSEVDYIDEMEMPPRANELRRVVRVFLRRKISVVGLFIIVALILTAIFAPLLAPYDPYKVNTPISLLQPTKEYLLGTDFVGRDVLSRIIYGSRTSLIVGISAVGIGSVIGQILGLLAAYFGRYVYTIIMRFVDAMMAFPSMILMVILAALFGGGVLNLVFALSIGMIPVSARLICAEVLRVKENDYVSAARSLGASNFRIMWRHLYPNCFSTLLVLMTIMLGTTILAEAGLSFLGLGIQPPGCAWGRMVSESYKYLLTNPLLSIAPGIAIMLVVFGFNMMGDGLRDALDPRLRGVV
jgi:peptide/nickel transport system permease protein